MTFNPDDFVFKKITLPEEDPTLLEYDAMSMFVIVRTVDQYGNKQHESCVLSRLLNENLLNGIPDKYSSRNDRIAQFYIRESGRYGLTKEKLKYDFKTNTSKWVKYDYNTLTLEEAKEIFDAIKAAVWTQDLINYEEMAQESLELAKKDVYINKMYLYDLQRQQELLRASDWRLLVDYPEKYEGEQENWMLWRSVVRDLIKKPEDFEKEIDYLIYREELKWPINPEQWDFAGRTGEYLKDDSHWSKSVDVKMTHDLLEEMNAKVNAYVSYIKDRNEEGIPITKQMQKTLEKYKLLNKFEFLTKFNVKGDES